MIKESFEKAKFGDRFITRGGKEALFLRLTENAEWQFADLYVKDWGQIRVNRENGKCLNRPDSEDDIVEMLPSLPSNLDEAAAEWMAEREKLIREKYYPFVFNAKDIFDAFKSGAEWMTRQGEIQEHFVIEHTEASHGHPVIVCYPESFGIGDKVEVIIRKKQ